MVTDEAAEQVLLRTIQRPELNIRGLRCADLKRYLPALSKGTLSRQLKRLRVFGLIKRVTGIYRYYLTTFGRTVIATCARLTEFSIVPGLASAT